MSKLFLTLLLAAITTGNLYAQERTITVTAMSQIKVVPDEAFLDFRVETRKAELMQAKEANDELALKVFAIAKKHGILSTDVSVFDMDVSPVYKKNNDEDEGRLKTPIAFRYLRSMQVRLVDFQTIEPFLVDCYKVGLEDLSGLSFRLSNQREHQFRARKLAVTYCREKADHLTELTGMKVGRPISIQESVERNWDAGGFGGGVFGASAQNGHQQGPDKRSGFDEAGTYVFVSLTSLDDIQDLDLVAPGMIEINAKVTVIYEMNLKN